MQSTRLSRLHPYPAMVADELAIDLVRRYLPTGAAVLDPFCGSGRLLAAAECASVRVGVDANPLAWLLTSAKLADASATIIADLVNDLARAKRCAIGATFDAFPRRKVEWFSPGVIFELERIVGWINALKLPEPERWLVACALSATTREVSFARQSGWKLHRLRSDERTVFSTCPWQRLERRLRYAITELRGRVALTGERFVALGSVGSMIHNDSPARLRGPYDIVLTSPPYGDSRTTVQYGAASALCLSVIAHIEGLEHLKATGNEIDAKCLGANLRSKCAVLDARPYWAGAGGGELARRVGCFLSDYEEACKVIAKNSRPGGAAILVVGRRSTGGFRLKLDIFTVDCFTRLGFELAGREVRKLQSKRTPRKINRYGGSASPERRERGSVITMASEIILVLRKRPIRATIDKLVT